MSWNRILLPLVKETICPDTVEIGNMAWECYRRANEPAGFAMFHATIDADGSDAKRIVYFSPVAASVCEEISEKYPFEPCEVPARDEQHLAYVFGDPLVKNQLRDTVSSDRLVTS